MSSHIKNATVDRSAKNFWGCISIKSGLKSAEDLLEKVRHRGALGLFGTILNDMQSIMRKAMSPGEYHLIWQITGS